MVRQAFLAMTVVVFVGAAAAWTAAQSKDLFVGTWEVNLAKSKYTPGPAPKSSTVVIEAAGSGYKITVKQVGAKGDAQNWSFTTNLDGTPSVLIGNNPNSDISTYTRVDAHTLAAVATKNGKETTRTRLVVSPDGKTRTNTVIGVDPAGQKMNNVIVLDRK